MPIRVRNNYEKDSLKVSPLGQKIISLLRYSENCIKKNSSNIGILQTLSMTINKLNNLLKPYLDDGSEKDRSHLN